MTTTTSTTTLSSPPRAMGGLALAFVSLALVTACPPAPAESSTDSESSTSSTSTSGTSNQTATVTITTTSATDSTTDPTTEGPTSSPTSATAGHPVCAQSDEFSCVGVYDCGESCGELGSRFDSEGCLRPSCSTNDDCSEGDVCYGANWGLCTSSGYSCSDEGGSCECSSDDDCSGNYCVPASVLPDAATSPTGARVDNDCAPDDGPAVMLEIGLADVDPEAACKDLGDTWMRLSVPDMGAPLAPGTYAVTQGNHSGGDPLGGGWLTIDSWDSDLVAGSYAVIFGASLYEGTFVDAVFCDTPAQCG